MGTTPVYSPIVGLYTCIAILENVFFESYPIHARRKQFFDARQKDGQSALEFREELLSLLEEALEIPRQIARLSVLRRKIACVLRVWGTIPGKHCQV